MKLVKEHINEKFTQNSDPIHDMSIGLSPTEILFYKIYKIAKRKYNNVSRLYNRKADDWAASREYFKMQYNNYYYEIALYDDDKTKTIKAFKSNDAIPINYDDSEINSLTGFIQFIEGYEHTNEKFTENGDPIKDMQIGHDAQMGKLDSQFKWDWSVLDYQFRTKGQIIDIIDYRDFHLKILKVIPLDKVTNMKTGDTVKCFYIAITDIGEPYVGDGPYKWNTPEEAIKDGKSGLDNYIDEE